MHERIIDLPGYCLKNPLCWRKRRLHLIAVAYRREIVGGGSENGCLSKKHKEAIDALVSIISRRRIGCSVAPPICLRETALSLRDRQLRKHTFGCSILWCNVPDVIQKRGGRKEGDIPVQFCRNIKAGA